jgi:hypothetical protein
VQLREQVAVHATSPVKRIVGNLCFVLSTSCVGLVCSDFSLSWKQWLMVLGWCGLLLLMVFWMIRRGSRMACIMTILGCVFTLLLSLLAAIGNYYSSVILCGIFLAAAVSHGISLILLLVALFRKKFPADPQFLANLNGGQLSHFFRNKNQFIAWARSFFTPFHGIFVVLALTGSICVGWSNFHPTESLQSKDGPAGKANRAFHVRGDGKDDTYLFAADWPYTFYGPFSIGGDSSLQATLYWSADGSLLYRFYRDRESGVSYISDLYDYREHRWSNFLSMGERQYWYHFLSRRHEMINLEKLVLERGGQGPEVRCLWK